MTEAGDAGSFTVVRTGDTSQSLDVPYTVSGAATAGSDYQALSGTATIPAGASSAVITLRPLADSASEGDESITVALTAKPGYLLALWRSATALIVANSGTSTSPGAHGALYPFSEGTGATTADLSGNGNTRHRHGRDVGRGQVRPRASVQRLDIVRLDSGLRLARSRVDRNGGGMGEPRLRSTAGTASWRRGARTPQPPTTTRSR